MADVFISYSKARSVEAAELAGELADLGYEVWWDTSLLPTGSFGAEIDRQLDAAKAVIVIWSPESLRSKWVRSEASHGDRQDKLVNTHTADPGVVAGIPKPLDLIHSVGLDNIRAIVGALDRLGVPRSRGTALPTPVAAPVSVADADHRLFAEVEMAATAEAYQFYLDEFPQGAHAPVTRFRLKALREVQAREAAAVRERAEATSPSPRPEGERDRGEGQPHAPSPPQQDPRQPLPLTLGANAGASGASALSPRAGRGNDDGRIQVDARIFHGASEAAKAGWLLPGAGKSEWFKDIDVGPEMVVVPAGIFTMGSKDGDGGIAERPQRRITISAPFALGRGPVTRGEFAAFVRSTNRDMSGGAYGWTGSVPPPAGWKQSPAAFLSDVKFSWHNPGFRQDDTHPVVCVGWQDAVAYTNWLEHETGKSYRLLSEAEWEYCCRATTETAYSTGTTISAKQANFGYNYKRTTSVGRFTSNAWGLNDMHGNAEEWCADTWCNDYSGYSSRDGTAWHGGDETSRVARGGSWSNRNAEYLRSAARGHHRAHLRLPFLGFRVARDLSALRRF